MPESKGNPLLIHAFAIMLAGAGLATAGTVSAVQAHNASVAQEQADEEKAAADKAAADKAKADEAAANDDGSGDKPADKPAPADKAKPAAQPDGAKAAAQGLQKTNTGITQTKADVTAVTNVTKARGLGVLSAGATALMATSRLKGSMSKLLDLGPSALIIALGIATIVMGVFVLKEKNWARLAGFGLLAFCLLYFTWHMGENMGDPLATPIVGILVLLVATPVAAKFLWDLFVEKFGAQRATA